MLKLKTWKIKVCFLFFDVETNFVLREPWASQKIMHNALKYYK